MLTKGSRRLYDWLKEQRAGRVVSYAEIMEVTKWSPVSLETYLKKRKLTPFLMRLEGDRLQVVEDGETLNERYFDETFTQTGPRPVRLTAGGKLTGADHDYTLEQSIGRGAVGQVWVALQDDMERRVASKVMLPRTDMFQASTMPNVRERFRRESKYGKTFDHPNVVRHLDYGQTERNPFLIMELAERSVADRLAVDKNLQQEEAAEVVDCCVSGLRHIHGKNHVHRDVKPANVLEFHDTFKLGDLGVVRWSDFDPIVTRGGVITRQSVQLGSWHYVSPEQQQTPHDAGPPADVYSLGVTWIHMLTGVVPIPQAVGARAYELPSLRDGIGDLIHSMCEYRVNDRPTLEAVQAAVRATYELDA